MTCIAWDGYDLAADKQISNNGLKRTTTKIWKINSSIFFGASGDAAAAMEMKAWVEGGRQLDAFPEIQRDDETNCSAFVIERVYGGTKLLVYEKSPHPMVFEDKIWATGSGRDFALAAMHLGCGAEAAVGVACHFDSGCGMGIDVLSVNER